MHVYDNSMSPSGSTKSPISLSSGFRTTPSICLSVATVAILVSLSVRMAICLCVATVAILVSLSVRMAICLCVATVAILVSLSVRVAICLSIATVATILVSLSVATVAILASLSVRVAICLCVATVAILASLSVGITIRLSHKLTSLSCSIETVVSTESIRLCVSVGAVANLCVSVGAVASLYVSVGAVASLCIIARRGRWSFNLSCVRWCFNLSVRWCQYVGLSSGGLHGEFNLSSGFQECICVYVECHSVGICNAAGSYKKICKWSAVGKAW